jgi:hypothetical protein
MLIRGYRSLTFLVLSVALALTAQGRAACAFDPNAGVTKESGPFALFKFGFSAY